MCPPQPLAIAIDLDTCLGAGRYATPWNHRLVEDPPYLVPMGRALLLLARQRSVELGYGGRVGLHLLPGSEAFYHRDNMAVYGPDPEKEGLVYFEYATLRP